VRGQARRRPERQRRRAVSASPSALVVNSPDPPGILRTATPALWMIDVSLSMLAWPAAGCTARAARAGVRLPCLRRERKSLAVTKGTHRSRRVRLGARCASRAPRKERHEAAKEPHEPRSTRREPRRERLASRRMAHAPRRTRRLVDRERHRARRKTLSSRLERHSVRRRALHSRSKRHSVDRVPLSPRPEPHQSRSKRRRATSKPHESRSKTHGPGSTSRRRRPRRHRSRSAPHRSRKKSPPSLLVSRSSSSPCVAVHRAPRTGWMARRPFRTTTTETRASWAHLATTPRTRFKSSRP